jgi:AcrR family transcriptional regulator
LLTPYLCLFASQQRWIYEKYKKKIMESTHKKSRGRPRELDRDVALDTALQLFWRWGYEGTSIANLTDALQTTPPSLYSLFGSKEQLYREVVSTYILRHGEFIDSAFEEQPNSYLAIKAILEKAVELYCLGPRPLGCMVGTGLITSAANHDHLSIEIGRFRLSTVALFKKRFDDAVSNGELEVGINTSALSTFYSAVVLGMSIQARDGVAEEVLKEVSKIALEAWPHK